MTSEVSACLMLNFLGILELDDGKFAGSYGPLINEVAEYFISNSNFTFDIRSKDDGFGEMDPATGKYDGCVGRLQRNESHLLFQLTDYPINATDVTQGDVGYDVSLQFVSIYYPRKESEVSSTSMDSCFEAFDVTAWSVCLATFAVVYLLLILRSKLCRKMRLGIMRAKWILSRERLRYAKRNSRIPLPLLRVPNARGQVSRRRRNKHHFSKILAHMARFGSLEKPRGAFKKVIFLICSFFSLLVVHYLSSSVNTDLVTVEPPEMYKSYQDLIDNKVSIVIPSAAGNIKEYLDSSPKLKQVYDYSLRHNNRAEVHVSNSDAKAMTTGYREFVRRKKVIIANSIFTPMFMREACRGLVVKTIRDKYSLMLGLSKEDEAKGPRPIWSQDESAKAIMSGLLLSDGFRGPAYLHIRKTLRTAREMGLLLKILNQVQEQDIMSSLGLDSGATESQSYAEILLCRQSVIKKPDVEVNSVTFGNFRHLFLLFIFILLVLTFALVLENVCDTWHN